MKRLKDIYLDIVVLVLVFLFAAKAYHWLAILLWIYTSLLLLSKVLALFMPALSKKTKSDIPVFIYHIIYLLIVFTFVFGAHYYYFAAAWFVIWVSSSIHHYAHTSVKK